MHTELDDKSKAHAPASPAFILGHQEVGRVVERGQHARRHRVGDLLGVGCSFILRSMPPLFIGNENLCTGFYSPPTGCKWGLRRFMAVPEVSRFPFRQAFSRNDRPLLCAGAIGWRSLRLTV
jgi:D-arabinose 1-dehydrogenase-like Zn-dependent alcohol dehydrogenase